MKRFRSAGPFLVRVPALAFVFLVGALLLRVAQGKLIGGIDIVAIATQQWINAAIALAIFDAYRRAIDAGPPARRPACEVAGGSPNPPIVSKAQPPPPAAS